MTASNAFPAAPTAGHYVIAERAGRSFALPFDQVRGGLLRPELEPVPLAPAGWLGVLVLRGEIVPVLQPDALLGVTSAREEPGTLVVFQAGDALVALAFDRVRGVVPLPAERCRGYADAAHLPWLGPSYSDERYAGLVLVDGPAFGAALHARFEVAGVPA